MRAMNGLVLSVVLGLVGAGVWIAFSRLLDIRFLVVLAFGVGALAGVGMALGTRYKGGVGLGVLTGVVCVLCCFVAKGTIAYFRAHEFLHDGATVSDAEAYDALCQDIYWSLVDEGVLHGDEETIPLAVFEDASAQWQAMSFDEQEAYKANLAGTWEDLDGTATGIVSTIAFLFSWSWLDIVCVFSATGMAYRFGSVMRHEESDEVPQWATGDASTLMAKPGAPPASVVNTAPAGTLGTPEAAPRVEGADSFWTRLGAEPPVSNTPSMKRTPKAAADGAGQQEPPRAEAA
ncbi:MAG: hypothetical protein KDA05_01655 [Phycisphaerales bacterium]|nr:hypothetical protein [Phycisphaerales bacterium]MCB9840993.1 hypothetical protein [Phycisphaeraceae bacterium]